ncbi:MAG TPA: hypothetical protein VHO47_00005, partial [Candidatus Babeliales bacterium]|nr:hypothetical protein [Candidatus Babeliales bacterium]
CNGTFSTLANLRVTASVDLSGVFTALAACCNGTFSSLANLRVTASVDLSGIFTTLADIETTLTACGAIPIFTATQITATGNYCLAKDIVGTITILSNEVSLDLNNRKITSSPLSSAILIDNVKDVIVKNGVVTLGGVFVQSSSVVTIDNIFSLNSVVASFSVVNSNTVEIINCQSSLNSAGNVCFARTVSGLTINNLNVDNGTVANGLFLTDINNLFVDKIAITAFSFNNDCINLASCCCVSISNISATKSNFQGSGTAIRGTSCSIVKIDGGEFAGNTLVSTSSRLITFSSCKDVNLNGIDISSNNFSNGFFSLIEHNDGIGDSSITNCNINANSLNGINRVASNFIFVGNTPCLIDGNNISSNTTSNTNRVNNFIRASGPELCIIDNIIDANSLNFSCTFINITGTGAALVEDSVISNNLISASLAGNSFTGIVSTASAIIRNTTIEGNVLVSGVAQDISSCISILGNYGIIEGATILSNQFGSNSISLGVSVTGSNSIVRGCSLIGNTFNGFIAKCISSTSTFGLIENNILVGNTSDVASSMDVISNTGSLSTIRNCLVSGNSVTTFGGIITGIRDTGSMNVIDSNKIVNNSGTVSSTGLNSNAGAFGNMIISNESKSHTNNYVIGTGAIPLVTISLSTALTTAITAGTVTCFHNVSTVA